MTEFVTKYVMYGRETTLTGSSVRRMTGVPVFPGTTLVPVRASSMMRILSRKQ